MRKGVKIFIVGKFDEAKFPIFLAEKAKENIVQGIFQISSDKEAVVYLVGEAENVENLIDNMFDAGSGIGDAELDIKPLDEDKDFRGVFRVVHNTD